MAPFVLLSRSSRRLGSALCRPWRKLRTGQRVASGARPVAGSDRLAEVASDGSLSLATAGRAPCRVSRPGRRRPAPGDRDRLAALGSRAGPSRSEHGPAGPLGPLPRSSPRGAGGPRRSRERPSLRRAWRSSIRPSPKDSATRSCWRWRRSARERGLGLWAEDRYKPAGGATPRGLGERAGQFAIVEGRVRSVGERRAADLPELRDPIGRSDFTDHRFRNGSGPAWSTGA